MTPGNADNPTRRHGHGVDEFAELLRDSPALAATMARPDNGLMLRTSRGMETLLGMSAARMRGSHLPRWFPRPYGLDR